jgi:uncharacterized protein YkwD
MMTYINKIILLILLLISNSLFAQTIDYKKVDNEKLASLIIKKINETRDSLKVKTLQTSTKSLLKAAENHSNYLVKTGKLSHGQTDLKYKDPQTRISTFGGKYNISAENVAFIGPNPNIPITYEELAAQFVKNWINSPGHFKNLSNPNLTETAVNVSFDTSKKIFYAVQVFGTPAFELSNEYKVPSSTYGIKDPGQDYFSKCKTCITFDQNVPAEVGYGVRRVGNDVYFEMNDVDWFDKMFTDKNDGLAVDIIQRDQFMCGAKNIKAGNFYRGVLLSPIFYKDLQKIAEKDAHHNVRIKLGTIPKDIVNKELEFNLMIFNDKNLCRTTVFYDVPNDKWNLLPMPLQADLPEAAKPGDTWLNKKMNFVIPFEKDKFNYKKEDMKPLYDSLNLTDYAIKSIKINAFASIEGTEQRNVILQQKRSESIIAALQDYQKEQIKQEVNVSENWVEFFQDIENTTFSKFKSMSKTDIKEQLIDLKDNVSLEKILSKHRKAILIIELEKRTSFGNNPEALQAEFNKLLSEKKINEASALQAYIYGSIANKSLSETVIDKIVIPEKLENGTLLNNDLVFKFELLTKEMVPILAAFNHLVSLKPKDPKINYNLNVLRLRKWLGDHDVIEPISLKNDIIGLSKFGVEAIQIKRLLLNYHLILAEKLLYQRKYAEKDQALKFINSTYKQAISTQKDYYELARFFARYSKFDWATTLLADKVTKVDVEEDVLFYYINLTLFDSKTTSKPGFRTILLNAANINKNRFCRMFNTIHSGEGAISFQLLNDEYLKKSYCEICE